MGVHLITVFKNKNIGAKLYHATLQISDQKLFCLWELTILYNNSVKEKEWTSKKDWVVYIRVY